MLAGLIAILSWLRVDDGRIGVSQPQEPAETSSDPVPATLSPDPAPEWLPEEAVALADPVAPPDGMREYLLSTPVANRNRILRLAVTEKGYECSSVKSANLVGADGTVWRAHCGATHIYWIVVGEFSQFSVAPMPYGDVDWSAVPDPQFVPAPPLESENQLFEPPDIR